MVEHRSHSAGLEYDASAGWKLRKLGRDIRRRRRHLRLVDDSAVSSHDANLRFRHRPAKYSIVGSPLPMTKPILSASAEEPRPLPDVEKLLFGDVRFSRRPTSAAFKKSAGRPANLSIGQRDWRRTRLFQSSFQYPCAYPNRGIPTRFRSPVAR